jgi:hypothetical protein
MNFRKIFSFINSLRIADLELLAIAKTKNPVDELISYLYTPNLIYYVLIIFDNAKT